MTLPLLSGQTPGDNALIRASVASMSAESVQCHCRTSETLVAYEAQLIMYCPQVVDDGPLFCPSLLHHRQ